MSYLDRAWAALMAGDARLASADLCYSEDPYARPLQAITSGLRDLSPAKVRTWLGLPNVGLGGRTPFSVLRRDDASTWPQVARLFGASVNLGPVGYPSLDEE